MHAANAVERLAEIAHDLWRDDMERRGWTCGPAYSHQAKHHDALVPFDRIDKHDRRQALIGIEALDLNSQLIGSIWYERGPARLFTVEEMHKGLRVAFNTAGITKDASDILPDPHAETGEVVSWEVDRDGFLCSVTVLWSSGVQSEHHPAARELLRHGEPQPGSRGSA